MASRTAEALKRNLWQQLIDPHPSITDIETRRQSLLLAGFTALPSVVLLLIAGWTLLDPSRSMEERHAVSLVDTVTAGIIAGLYFLNRAGKYRLSAYGFVVVTFLVSHLPLLRAFPYSGFLFFTVISLLLSSIFLGLRATLALSAISLVLQVFFLLTAPRVLPLSTAGFLGLTVFAVPIILIFMQHRVGVENERRAELEAANAKLRASEQELQTRNQQLRESEADLERRVAERTRDLQVASDVARQITTTLDMTALLQAVVERTRAGFDLYCVAVFLYDSASDCLVLEAASGAGGLLPVADDYRLKLHTTYGLIADAARQATAGLANDVAHEPRYHADPRLPDTRSELALPMWMGDTLIGVLDLRATQINRFSADDVRVMTALAEQTAIAVNNARLYAEQMKVADQLRAVDHLKSQFLASVSHELRTPLNAILNFTQFVSLGMLGPVNDAQVDALNKALDSGRHLLSLINDVLDISKIQSGALKVFVEDNIDLQVELQSVMAAAQALLKGKAVTFVQDIDAHLPAISGDKRRIRQILLNLLSNAAKFTEEGSITLSVKDRGTGILFAVIDTGPGIAPEDQQIIFEPFVQTAVGIQHLSGTGLGLPISKYLAEAHGGRLWVESEPGHGAAFYMTLPVAKTAPDVPTEKQHV